MSAIATRKTTTLMAAAMREKGLSYPDLSARTGRDIRTLHNLASGNNTSKSLRQLVTNILCKRVWPDVEVTQRILFFRPGTPIEYSSAQEARECAADELAAGICTLRGRVVTFVKAATYARDIHQEETQSAKTFGRHQQ